MSAPRERTGSRSESTNTRLKDVVLCEGSPARLILPRELITKIWEQVNQGLRSASSGGCEIGGLFQGCRSQTGDVLADAVVPIPIEHQFGPSYRLSPADFEGIKALMASLQEDPAKTVLGFYRSRIRSGSLSEDSESAILTALEESHPAFHADFHYFVVFTPLSKLRMTVSGSFRSDDGWGPWQHVTLVTNLSTPSPSTDSLATEASPGGSSSGAQPVPSTAAAPSAELIPTTAGDTQCEASPLVHEEPHSSPFPTAPEAHIWPGGDEPFAETSGFRWHKIGLRSRIWLYAAGGVLVALAVLASYRRHYPAVPRAAVREAISAARLPNVRPASLALVAAGKPDLSARWDGSIWRLAWNREAVEALHPASVVLSIRDGDRERPVRLGTTNLSAGSLIYAPQAGNLLFTLKIVTPDRQMVEEHIRVLDGQIIEMPAESFSQAGEPEESRAPEPLTPGIERPSPFAPRRVAKGSASRSERRTLSVSGRPSANHSARAWEPHPTAEPAAVNTRGHTLTALPPPPMIRQALPDTSFALGAPPCCTATATYEAAGPTTLRRVIHKVPVVRRLDPGAAVDSKSFVAPRPIHDIKFAIPPDASPVLMEKQQMDLKASLDASGRVIRVKLLSPRDKALLTLAEYAAREWRFEPAQRNDQPVPGEIVLHFSFDTNSAARAAVDKTKGR